ncbi:methyl-accepting chemotaxis protein [Vibrio intestinalis]|uniref:methyl-accepting chemotaxis protein n=1 Tax=Vibrio intestinalis TaxID=2933291 RepID=UPI0021A68833|nr:methyl-accepting chemotaxis protein [Vibrio intestinalis]
MKIKTKLYLLGTAAVLGIVSILFASNQFAQTTNELNTANQLTTELEVRLLNLRRNEKDFLLRSDMKYLSKFSANIDTFKSLEGELSPILQQRNLPTSAQLRSDITTYQQSFVALVNAFQKLGLDEKSGLIGEYNQALYQVKQTLSADELVKLIAFDDQVQHGKLDTALLPADANILLAPSRAVIAQKQIIGLKYNQGLLGETRKASHTIEEQFKAFSSTLASETETAISGLTTIKHTVVAITLIVILAFVAQIVRSITSKIDALLSVIRQIVDTNDVSLRAQVSGKDELANLGQYFNQLLDKLAELLSSTQSKSNQLSHSTTRMHDELETVISQFQVQADHTNSMATSVQEMVSTISEISESTSVAAEGVHQASKNAEKSRQVVVETVDNISQLSERLANSQQSITSLNHHVDKIGDAVNIIQDIAEQTNLLALNAAIEAARAGEQGRGFAVVADEVRALASRTHQSTTEITNVVTSIQSQMSTVISDIDQCSEQGRHTLTGSDELDQSLQQILNDMHAIQANSERIASAIEEQGAVMTQVSDSITELNTISDGNTQSAHHCLQEVDKVSCEATEMDKTVSQFKTA